MKFELRTLNATDIFPMSTIISKVGINEFKKCFESDEIKKLIKGQGKGNETAVGIAVALDIGGVILGNLHKCENDIYTFLGRIANVDVEEIKVLSMGEFAELIIEVVKKPEFKDFFSVVSKLFKSEK
jgi:hypothetical protein